MSDRLRAQRAGKLPRVLGFFAFGSFRETQKDLVVCRLHLSHLLYGGQVLEVSSVESVARKNFTDLRRCRRSLLDPTPRVFVVRQNVQHISCSESGER